MAEESEIHALLQLLDEKNETFAEQIIDKLLSYASKHSEFILPYLNDILFDAIAEDNKLLEYRAKYLITEIENRETKQRFKQWLAEKDPCIEEGLILLNRDAEELLSKEEEDLLVRQPIEALRKKIWLKLGSKPNCFSAMEVLADIIFKEEGFITEIFQDGKTSFDITQILREKRGSILHIGALFMLFGQKLNLSIYGIIVPGSFALSICGGKIITDFSKTTAKDLGLQVSITQSEIGLIADEDIEKYLLKANVGVEKYLRPIGGKEIIKEILANYMLEKPQTLYQVKRDIWHEILEMF